MHNPIRALVCLCLAPLGAFAQDGGFSDADTDSNKSISVAELKAYVSRRVPDFTRFDALMKQLDADNNGSLSEEEFARRMQAVQKVMQRSQGAQEVVEFADRYERMFASRKPKVGDTIPDISAFDENGKELSLSATNGKYRVIVFGCLT